MGVGVEAETFEPEVVVQKMAKGTLASEHLSYSTEPSRMEQQFPSPLLSPLTPLPERRPSYLEGIIQTLGQAV